MSKPWAVVKSCMIWTQRRWRCMSRKPPMSIRMSKRNCWPAENGRGTSSWLPGGARAAWAVHHAKAADVHQNVEAELLASGERTRHLVVAAAMAQAEVDDFATARLARGSDCLANLTVGVMTVAVQERGGEFDFERIFAARIGVHQIVVEQIHKRRGFERGISHQFGGGLLKFAARLDFVAIGIGVLDQRGCDPHFAQEFAFSAIGDFGRYGANLGNQGAQRFFVRVVGRRNRRLFQKRPKVTDFLMRLREQVGNLGFERAGIDDLPE